MVACAVDTYGRLDALVNQNTIDDPAKLERLTGAIPLGRLASSQDIADLVVFLASGQNDYMTATSVFVDGGIVQSSVGL
jgi:glucose 1-dehydrogenase